MQMEEKEIKSQETIESANDVEQVNEWRKKHGFPAIGVAFVESAKWDDVIKERHGGANQFKGKEV